MISKLLWKYFHKGLIRHYIKDASKPVGFSDLKLAFTDLNGKKYYQPQQGWNIPIERLGKLQEFTMWMSAAISPEELDKLIDAADRLLTDGIKHGKNAAKIGAILSQIKDRRKMCIHTELLYNYAACSLIREDEVVDKYDNDIQMQKVEQFKKEVAASNSYFFFHQTALKNISLLFQLSESEWNQYWGQSVTMQKEVMEESLKIYLSEVS